MPENRSVIHIDSDVLPVGNSGPIVRKTPSTGNTQAGNFSITLPSAPGLIENVEPYPLLLLFVIVSMFDHADDVCIVESCKSQKRLFGGAMRLRFFVRLNPWRLYWPPNLQYRSLRPRKSGDSTKASIRHKQNLGLL